MRESRPYGSVRGARGETRVPTATHKPSLIDGGAPLGKTKRVDANGASNAKNQMGGYSVVQAETHDAATKMFGKEHPHLQVPGAWIEIVEIMPLPGM
jgi:hypothetical protein